LNDPTNRDYEFSWRFHSRALNDWMAGRCGFVDATPSGVREAANLIEAVLQATRPGGMFGGTRTIDYGIRNVDGRVFWELRKLADFGARSVADATTYTTHCGPGRVPFARVCVDEGYPGISEGYHPTLPEWGD
jgi:hypothetical protein